MLETVTIGLATLHLGDCREMLATLGDGAANWCVTDTLALHARSLNRYVSTFCCVRPSKLRRLVSTTYQE
jgi:hypothetical protein